MKLIKTPINGAWLIEISPSIDERGFFARSMCVDTMSQFGLCFNMKQQSVSYNLRRGTLRGMHYQREPYGEIKLVRVTQGRVYDVILDLRRDSPSYLQWHALELSAKNHCSIYIPNGVAHGFQTLEDDSEVFYQMSQTYESSHSTGVRWDDPVFAINWPINSPILSERDLNHKPYQIKFA